MNSMARQAFKVVVALATAVATASVAAAIFLNPMWIGFEQDRSDVAGLTGYTPQQVRDVTGSILSDLVVGPPDFDVAVNGSPVLDPRERGHMADVRTVFAALGLVALAAWLVLLAAALVSRLSRGFWRAVRAGSLVLAVVVVVGGGAFGLFFDQAFELMHETFFPAGTYTFDPRTERLVQLFPTQFWMDSSVALALAALVLALGLAFASGRLAGRGSPPSVRVSETGPES
jgi:integral membrane protein (TIGR01906 family)